MASSNLKVNAKTTLFFHRFSANFSVSETGGFSASEWGG
jgi:hypothetical protein